MSLTKEYLNKMNNLNTSTSTRSESIQFKVNKDNDDTFANFIFQNFNQCIIGRKFHNQLKKVIVSPTFKKVNHNGNTNYPPTSILPWLSDIYERLIYNQINQMTKNVSSVYFSVVFAKKYCIQYALIAVIGKVKKSLIIYPKRSIV